ncbi:C-terminal processing protease CtpA/Prc [Salinibacter ruber]|uniref:S41 family peptidase n=1 Tax=Salinibacter ruber TaxID=146919 RepID=UPI002168B4A2|nr:C-terminal processing protease CtpA/Prc [Salinibacter ruber]MCS3653491.1 C-terminal processing protease CtpA/Prc [Salinibacter ruber]
MRRSTLVAAGLVLLAGAAALTYTYRDTLGLADPPRGEQVENLRAFATLYGYVRYFHPSDAAANTDWDAFAIHGVRQAKNAANRAELRAELEALFEPIAPTIQLYRTGNEPPTPADVLAPSDTAGLNLVAWQHQGIGLEGNLVSPYRSIRLNRVSNTLGDTGTDEQQRRAPAAQILRILDAVPYAGQQVKVRAAVKTRGDASHAHLSLSPLRTIQSDFLDEGASRPITSQDWSVRERTREVASARGLVIGAFVDGNGTAWLDNVELLTRDSPQDEWTSVALNNPGFESAKTGERPIGWTTGKGIASYTSVTAETAHDGDQSLKLESPLPSQVRLFPERPSPGEVVNKPLGRGLSVQLPLALHSRDGRTLRPADAPSPAALRDSLRRVETPILKTNPPLRLADVTIAWNIFQHFYPYFEAVDVNWDAVLTRTLRRALADDTSTRDFLQTLRRMVAQLEDGHGRVHHSQESSSSGLPVRFGRIGDEIVVVDTAGHLDRTLCPDVGDVVVSIGGRPPEQRLQERKRYISGSPQWTEGRALQQLGRGDPGSKVSLTVRRGGTENTCEMTRSDRRIRWRQLRLDDRPNTMDTLRAGVRYVDLTRAEWPTLQQHLGELADADGVVFDLRGYPTGGARKLLPHLSGDTLQSARFQVPQLIYPDQKNLVGYDASGRWTLPPEEPQITGDVAFLTGPGAISYAESIMGIVGHYDLGTIVGQPTAGTNGNVNPFELPGGYKVWWTGMRVRKHDGSQHHLVGIRPDIEAERTIEGVRNGRDEVLEKALEVLRSSRQDSSSERGATASN